MQALNIQLTLSFSGAESIFSIGSTVITSDSVSTQADFFVAHLCVVEEICFKLAARQLKFRDIARIGLLCHFN